MDFTVSIFWIILLTGLFLFFLANGVMKFVFKKDETNFHKASLAIISLTLLGTASIETLVLFLTLTSVSYIAGTRMVKLPERQQKHSLGVVVCILLAPLIYYKYRFFVLSLFGVTTESNFTVFIPIGISFYTFQIIGYLIDSRRTKDAIPSFLDYINFVSFFSQIVAGPIERRDDLLPQMAKFRFKLDFTRINFGLRFIILGLFFKLCLGDNLAICYMRESAGNPWAIWFNNIGFGLRIYFDFAGYGLTAYGLAHCLGVKLIMNFLSPYSATNISDFWRRWHISLTNWFRDYIYFSIGGSRTKFWAANLIFVFLISGLWHGSSWNFVLWGGLNGVGLVVHKIFRKQNILRLPSWLSYIITMFFVFFTWMVFHERSMGVLVKNIGILFDMKTYAISTLKMLARSNTSEMLIMSFCLVVAAVVVLLEHLGRRIKKDVYSLLTSTPAILVQIFMLVWFSSGSANEFIYFAF
jgi:Predicted membrane protein involved in D-alanine export